MGRWIGRMVWLALVACASGGDDGAPTPGGLVDLPSIVEQDLRLLFADGANLADATTRVDAGVDEATSQGPGECTWAWTLNGTAAWGTWAGVISPVPCGGASGALEYDIRESALTGTWTSGAGTVTVEGAGQRTGSVIRDERTANISYLARELSLSSPTGGSVTDGYVKFTYRGYGGGDSHLELGITSGTLLGVIRGVGPVCEVTGTVEAPAVQCDGA